jgi:hypothetical protein
MCEALIGGAGTSMQAVDGVTGRRSSLRRPAGCWLHLDANVVRVPGVCVAGCPPPSEFRPSGPERSWIFWKDFGG